MTSSMSVLRVPIPTASTCSACWRSVISIRTRTPGRPLRPPHRRWSPTLRAAAWLGALVAIDASDPSFAAVVDDALGAGVAVDQLVSLLLCLAPVIGSARVISAAPAMAAALGLDIDTLLEGDGDHTQITT